MRKYILWCQGGKESTMDKRPAENRDAKSREFMIVRIIQAIRQMDTRKLRNVYHFVQNIK